MVNSNGMYKIYETVCPKSRALFNALTIIFFAVQDVKCFCKAISVYKPSKTTSLKIALAVQS